MGEVKVPSGDVVVSDFDADAARISQLIGVDPHVVDEVTHWGEEFGLEPRERLLLANELAFFTHNPPDEDTRKDYWSAYEDAAEKIMFGLADQLDEHGWKMRWGATSGSVNSAMRMQLGNASFEHVVGGAASHLRYVLFNEKHEEILDQHGFCVRKLGRQ